MQFFHQSSVSFDPLRLAVILFTQLLNGCFKLIDALRPLFQHLVIFLRLYANDSVNDIHSIMLKREPTGTNDLVISCHATRAGEDGKN